MCWISLGDAASLAVQRVIEARRERAGRSRQGGEEGPRCFESGDGREELLRLVIEAANDDVPATKVRRD